MKYEVILTDSFLKDLRKLRNKSLQDQILKKLLELEENPERNKRLRYELNDYYRLRIGKIRVLYSINGDKVYIEVLVKDHRYDEI